MGVRASVRSCGQDKHRIPTSIRFAARVNAAFFESISMSIVVKCLLADAK
jgi:hypothetical protein